jgi:hypothetical protein
MDLSRTNHKLRAKDNTSRLTATGLNDLNDQARGHTRDQARD